MGARRLRLRLPLPPPLPLETLETFYFILEVLTPEKHALSVGERSSSRWPNFTFFIFPGIVLPFCYFSVVRKVTEKPVLFLPHPDNEGISLINRGSG